MQLKRDYHTRLRRFHEAKWDEEIIYELSIPGQRGVLVPKASSKVENEVGDGISVLPDTLRRKTPPPLPEVHQMRVNRHYMRLSQEVLGADVTPDIGQGTCTMKYSPKVQEHLVARNPNIVDVHPMQDPETLQGLLEIYYKTDKFMQEISGMDEFSFHAGGGANACFGGVSIVRAYHESRGDTKRDEIITTMFSHPCDAGAPATGGYKVVTLMPDKNGYPDLEALKSALSERTAAIFLTNPEDTGIFNPRIREYVDAAHEMGALCYYDQANVNGIMGITRAKEAGFDIIHYNLHKTFSSPHGGMGPGCGGLGVKESLIRYLPVPRVKFNGTKYYLDYNCPESIGQLRSFLGNIHIVIRAYMWIMQMGADGIKEAAICSVLNNQYMMKKVAEVPGVKIWYAQGIRRLEQCRYSWEKLKEDTGFGTEDVTKRLIDFGLEHYWTSHHPWVVPEPFTLEPCESYSKDDIDEFVAVLKQVATECYEQPDIIKNAPHNAPIHNIEQYFINEHEKIAATWKQWKKRKNL